MIPFFRRIPKPPFAKSANRPAPQCADPLARIVAVPESLKKAWHMVRAAGGGCGIDNRTLDDVAAVLPGELASLETEILSGRFQFLRLRSAAISKADGDKRMLGIPAVRDRIVLQSVRLTLEPACERQFHNACHAYRPGRGAESAMKAMADGMASGLSFVAETDIRKFFDSVSHKLLLATLRRLVPQFTDSPLLQAAFRISPGRWPAKIGLAQGSPLSPLLANVSLIDFDRAVSAAGVCLVRYADDLILLAATQAEAEHALKIAARQLAAIGLKLHPDKTRIIDSRKDEFEFLGFRFQPDRILPSAENWTRLQDEIRELCEPQQTLTWLERIDRINALIRSFAWYYQQTDCGRMLWNLDQFVREQLLSLEQKTGRRESTWREKLVTAHHLREVRYAGKSAKSRRWNGYG